MTFGDTNQETRQENVSVNLKLRRMNSLTTLQKCIENKNELLQQMF